LASSQVVHGQSMIFCVLARDGPARDRPARDGPARDGPARDGPARDGPAYEPQYCAGIHQ